MKRAKKILFLVSPLIEKQLKTALINPPLIEVIKFIVF